MSPNDIGFDAEYHGTKNSSKSIYRTKDTCHFRKELSSEKIHFKKRILYRSSLSSINCRKKSAKKSDKWKKEKDAELNEKYNGNNPDQDWKITEKNISIWKENA